MLLFIDERSPPLHSSPHPCTRHKQLYGSKRKQREELGYTAARFLDSEPEVGGCRWSSFSSVRSPSPVATLWEFLGLKL